MQLLMMPLKKKQLIKRMPDLDGADSTQDVYFTVKDSNLVRNQIDEKTVVYLDFYIEDPQKNPNDETIGTGNDKIYLKKVD